jgi:hypothetical protein
MNEKEAVMPIEPRNENPVRKRRSNSMEARSKRQPWRSPSAGSSSARRRQGTNLREGDRRKTRGKSRQRRYTRRARLADRAEGKARQTVQVENRSLG